ncbi:glycosyl hydrolase [Dyadobacter aurulentus]|uniref:glycosyl hydrolase n=1 Tax=Dyadobacter sp. UC 10 TaxID=2605428 RepID=UPI0011F32D7D|nr:glycosyl hydrolase [Dyadobacter sp. UC 10]KAA0990194.1 glycoside hydrolase [Dyadobacter sp. UC 10]
MKKLFILLIILTSLNIQAQPISTAKPWTYWWWMSSTVKKEDISAQLQFFKTSGIGGVHIIPIYGVKGLEKEAIPFLSSQWLDMMQFTVKEGKRLRIGVDLTTGTGWPFGGPNVSQALAAKTMKVKNGKADISLTGQKVKRAAPGGEGFVLDPFHYKAMPQYLSRFDSAFNEIAELPRSMYMDSYEAYGANWTDDFPEEFKKRRRYDILEKLDVLSDSTQNSENELIRIDYHQTLAELLLERYAKPWTEWSKKEGFLTRYQAHGSPGNLLDLYATATIPETESFGTSRFDIPGLRVDPDYSIDQFGTPNPLAMKFASSAAHLNGKKLVSSETGTWLANHFKVSLSQIKPQVDELFASGINHIFYHGTNYSPTNAPYPGWLFYASTHFGPTSHFAKEFPLLNKYVTFCQERLQNSKPDNDILVYFPIHDLWATKAKSSGNIHLLEVHHVDRWLLDLPFGKLTQKLWNAGYSFDFVSDLQLRQLTVKGNNLITSADATYKTILIPSSTYIPLETLRELKRIAAAGVRIIFEENMPKTVTGFADHASNQAAFQKEAATISQMKHVQISADFEKALANINVYPEELAQKGLTFIRKKTDDGRTLYFVTNLSNKFKKGWLKLGTAGAFTRIDPLGAKSLLPFRQSGDIQQVYLQLLPGQSCFLESGAKTGASPEISDLSHSAEITGTWELTFLKGRPSKPANAKMERLDSWTTLPDSAKYFSGTARYTIRFDTPADLPKNKSVVLDLGDVRETARVTINGQDKGTAWCIPFRINLNAGSLKPKDNVLEIEITNLSANYMRLRDKQQPEWKKFLDINIVDITYKKFDASTWEPMPSGLLGPVKLIY